MLLADRCGMVGFGVVSGPSDVDRRSVPFFVRMIHCDLHALAVCQMRYASQSFVMRIRLHRLADSRGEGERDGIPVSLAGKAGPDENGRSAAHTAYIFRPTYGFGCSAAAKSTMQ